MEEEIEKDMRKEERNVRDIYMYNKLGSETGGKDGNKKNIEGERQDIVRDSEKDKLK